MDKKAKKRIELLRKKIADLQPRLAGAASRWTTPTKSASSKPSSPPPKQEIEKLKLRFAARLRLSRRTAHEHAGIYNPRVALAWLVKHCLRT